MAVRGLFISFEGGEGSGKSAQCAALVKYFEDRGHAVRFVREPGGTSLGERVRDILLFQEGVAIAPETEALLFTAARAQLTRDVIRPALESGTHVIADRFFDSTFAYQGYGRGIDLTLLRALTQFAVGTTTPDITFLLDLPIESAQERIRARGERWDRIERAEEPLHLRVRDGYLTLARQEPQRWTVIDATRAAADIGAIVRARIDEALSERVNRIAFRR